MIMPPTNSGKRAGETNQTFCTPPQLSFMGILDACQTIQAPNRKMMMPEYTSAFRSLSFSSMMEGPQLFGNDGINLKIFYACLPVTQICERQASFDTCLSRFKCLRFGDAQFFRVDFSCLQFPQRPGKIGLERVKNLS